MQSLKPYPPFRRFWISSSELLRNQKQQVGVMLKTLPLMLLLTGCVSVNLNNSERLMEHPGFRRAAYASPEFVKEALKTINELEYELERK
jgi:hypothetical protein